MNACKYNLRLLGIVKPKRSESQKNSSIPTPSLNAVFIRRMIVIRDIANCSAIFTI